MASCRESCRSKSGRGRLGCLFRCSLHKGLFLTFVVDMRSGIIVQVLVRVFGSIEHLARALLSSMCRGGWGGIHN